MRNRVSHPLRDAKAYKSMKDQLEHWKLYLHWSYVTSELYRPTLNQSGTESETTTALQATCMESLADTVDAFLGLENITRFRLCSARPAKVPFLHPPFHERPIWCRFNGS
jgi:hypothetical protein